MATDKLVAARCAPALTIALVMLMVCVLLAARQHNNAPQVCAKKVVETAIGDRHARCPIRVHCGEHRPQSTHDKHKEHKASLVPQRYFQAQHIPHSESTGANLAKSLLARASAHAW